MKKNDKAKIEEGQMSFFDLLGMSEEPAVPAPSAEAKKPVEKSKKKPATPLMKKVARKAPSRKSMKKVFSPEERKEILEKIKIEEQIDNDARMAIRKEYRRIKRIVKEMEMNNQSKIIAFPSMTNGTNWYKTANFSALYYAYRLAERMGRHADIYADSDKHSKVEYIASLTNIEDFAEQFVKLDGGKYSVTKDGIWIFELRRPLTDDQVGALRRVEQVRRDKMHNIFRPKAMDPNAYNVILMLIRQVVPRAKKLEAHYRTTLGEQITKDITQMMAIYYAFADGALERKEAGILLIRRIDSAMAALTTLAESRIWRFDVATAIGENLNQAKMIVLRDFNVEKKGGTKNA